MILRGWFDLKQDWDCLFLKKSLDADKPGLFRYLRNARACQPSPNDVFRSEYPGKTEVSDRLQYVPGVWMGYRYDVVSRPDRSLDLYVRIQFTGRLARQRGMTRQSQALLDRAAEIWTSSSPRRGIRFHFQAVGPRQRPHFQVSLLDDSLLSQITGPIGGRPLFNRWWRSEWFHPENVLLEEREKQVRAAAHEVGHMMGLMDEYDMPRSIAYDQFYHLTLGLRTGDTMRDDLCHPSSLMCDSGDRRSEPLPYHYYLILRRAYCQAG